MSTTLRQIKLFFVTIAIISILFLLYTINWNVSIYKFSSEISQVNYRNARIPDNATSRRYTIIAKQYLAGAKNITFHHDNPDNELDKLKELFHEFPSNETKLINQLIGNSSHSDKQRSGEKNENSLVDGVIGAPEYYDGTLGSNDNNHDKVTDTVNQVTKADTESEEWNGYTDKVKDKSVNDKDADNIAKVSDDAKTSDTENDNTIQHIQRVHTKLNKADTGNYNETEIQKDIIKSKDTNDLIETVAKRVHDSVKNIQLSAEDIASARKELHKVKSKWVKRKKKKNETLSLPKDKDTFRRVKNQLKQLGHLGQKLKPSASKLGTKFETISLSGDGDTTSRPDECTSCFKNNFKIIINEPDLCNGGVSLLILITSSALNVQNRKGIRNTWGKVCNDKGSGIKCAFVFGTKYSNYENNFVKKESEVYHDIILFDFYDVYANLTYKTLSSIRWSHEFCSQAKYVMKTDDDMYVNTELLPFLLKKAPDQEFIGGMCWGPSSPHRDTNSKWFVSFVQYRHSLFPSMCSGTGYVMSRDVADGILRQSPNIPFFYLEDVYVAICVKQLNVRPLVLDGFKNTLVDFDPCVFRNRYITVHGLNGPELETSWKQIQECPVDDLTQSIIYNGFPV
ncbi:Beta-1 [Mactra antiquata]